MLSIMQKKNGSPLLQMPYCNKLLKMYISAEALEKSRVSAVFNIEETARLVREFAYIEKYLFAPKTAGRGESMILF